MAGNTTQTITSRFKTEGAGKVVKETEQIGRAQTRLGQASASAGRQFSAQASGLGGLVAAYAGAAATIFAITAAFTALNQAARAEQTITGVNALANAIGESGPKIIKGLQEITKGQLSIVQTAELANLALSSGFSADQINNLAEISLKASRALGRDLTDSFNRLVRGVTKLEPELLDELGIFTRLDPAVEAYAKNLGKTVGSLSNFERRQAFANAVAQEGSEKFRDIDTTANTSAESLEKLAATLGNLGTQVGGFIASTLQPLAEALSAPVTAVGAFGILARTVFGTTLREARSSFEGFEEKVDAASGTLVDKLGGGSKKAKAAVANLGKELDTVNLRTAKVSATNEEAFKKYVALGRAQQLSFRDAQKLQGLVAQEITDNKKRVQALEGVRNPTKAQINQIGVLTRRNAELSKVADATNARINTTGKVSRIAAKGVRGLGVGFAAVSRGALGLLSALTTVITVVSLFATVGSVILNAFGWLDPLVEGVSSLIRRFRIFLGLQEELIQQSKVLNELLTADQFRDLKFTTPGFEGIIDKEALSDAVKDAIASGQTGTLAEFTQGIRDNLSDSDKKLLNTTANVRLFTQEIERLFGTVLQGVIGLGPGALQGVSEFAEATGRTIKSTFKALSFDGDELRFKGIEDSVGPLKEISARFKDTSQLVGEARKEADAFNASQIQILQSQEVQKNLTEAIASGAANAEQIEKRRSAVIAKISSLQADLEEKENGILKLRGAEREEVQRLVVALQQTFDLTDRSAQAQLAILNEREKILKTFSSEIKAAEKLNDIFSIIQDGDKVSLSILDDKNKRRQNQVSLLIKDFELGKQALAQERQGVELTGQKAQLATLARDAEKALVGLFVQSNEEARKLAEQLEKILQKETARLSNLQGQLKVAKAQRAVVEAEQEIEDVNKVFASRLKLFDLEQKLAKSRRTAALDVLTTEQDLQRIQNEGRFMTDRQKRELEIQFKEDQLKELRAFTEKEEANIQKRVRIQKTQVFSEIKALANLLGAGDGTIAASFDAQRTAETNAINARRDIQLSEIDLLEERNKGIITQAQSFTSHIEGIAKVLAADLVARAEVLEGENFVKNTQKMLLDAGKRGDALNISSVGDARRARVDLATPDAIFKAEGALSMLISRLEGADFQSIRTTITDAAKAEQELADLRLNNAESDKIRSVEARLDELKDKLVEVGIEGDVQLQELATNLQKGINDLNRDVATNNVANDRMGAALKEVTSITESYVTNGLMDLNNALIEGSFTFKDLAQGFRNMLQSMLKEIQAAVFRKTVAEPIAEGIAGFLPKLFAAGGLAHLAGGGAMKRDRVAALLEPGEFVIRKEAAKKLGMSKLQELNAGTSDDPLARLIAMFGSSKVVQRVPGGSLGFGGATGDLASRGSLGSGNVGRGRMDGPGSVGFGSEASSYSNNFGTGGSDSYLSAAKSFISAGKNPYSSSAQSALALSMLGKSMGMPGAIKTEDALDVERKIDYAKKSATFGGKEFDLKQAYQDANKGAFQKTLEFLAPSSPLDVIALAAGTGLLGKTANTLSKGYSLTKGVLTGYEEALTIQDMGLEEYMDFKDRVSMQQAAGGPVRMAGGGSVRSRDRVPALLEPGEFVIRRPMAKAIGGAALNTMNATGRPPQISVNVSNSGMPKDVNVQAPKVNGDKIILDIITRDLRNNGAIKKSLRKGK